MEQICSKSYTYCVASMQTDHDVESRSTWTFLTNHAHVMIAISRNPEIRQRDVADQVGITIGAVQRIVHELVEGGYLISERVGRRNHYRINGDKSLRHPMESGHNIDELVTLLKA